MKQNKAILVFGILLSFFLIMFNTNVSKATEGETKELYIVNHSSDGAYSMTVDEGYLEIWKIIERTNNYNNNIYCIKGGPGFGSNEDDTNPIMAKNYTWRSNFKDVNATLGSSIVSLPKDENVTGIQIKNGDTYQTVTYNNYNAILWLIDNMYIPKLTKLSKSNDSGINIPNTINEMKANLFRAAFSDYIDSNLTDDQVISAIGLTDDDIEVIQQLALWHFTNTKNSTNETYKKFDVVSYNNGQIQYRFRQYNSKNAQVIRINTIMLNGTSFDNEGLSKQTSAEILFTYLVHNAMLHANDYGTSLENPRDLTIINPLVFTETTLAKETANGKNIIGPFHINERVVNKEYELSVPEIISKTNSNNKISSYTIYTLNNNQKVLFATSQTITEEKMKELVGKDFYIEVAEDADLTEKVLSINIKYLKTTADFWMVSGSNGSTEQPVIIIDKDYENNNIEKEINFNKSKFDLALRKFITAVNGVELKTGEKREPVPEYVENYKNTDVGRFIYKHDKYNKPVEVEPGDVVTYTIRVYNEGNVSGYAQSIIDDIPEGLEYIGPVDNSYVSYNTTDNLTGDDAVRAFNQGQKWNYDSTTHKLTTNILAYQENDVEGNKNRIIDAFDKKNMTIPAYKDVQIQFKVKGTNLPNNRILINTAEIADDRDENGNEIKDFDSFPGNNNTEEEDTNYNFKEDDIDKEYLKVKTFDLALRKFITSLNGVELKTGNKYTREPVISINSQTKKITYTHPKTPVIVKNGDIVVYTIRIFNEGQTDGYAEEVTDYLPEGTKFIETNQINIDYRWSLDSNDTTGRTISTNYLSKERDNIEKRTLLKAFDGTNVDYIDLKIAVEVTEKNDTTKPYLENIAEITDDRDKNGKEVDDIDSTPKNKEGDTRNADGSFGEDDTDFERIRLQVFDMALREFITAVNGVEIKTGEKYTREPNPVFTTNYLNTGIDRFVYKHKKDEDPVRVATGDLVTYTIRVYNEGTIDGYIQLIYADIPTGLEYVPSHETNTYYKWTLVNGRLTTDCLSYQKNVENVIRAYNKDTMTSGPDYKDVKIVFKVTESNSSTRMIAHTSQIADEADTNGNIISSGTLEDIDSIPANDNEAGKDADHNFKEDDIDKDYIILKQFDLALRKFITAVNENELKNGNKYDREPVPEYVSNYKNTGKGRFVYKHKKNEAPVSVSSGNIVTYTIRIYNEGDIDGYAQEIVDDIPDGLEFLPENDTNKLYGWVKSGNKVKTEYLSSQKAVGNVIQAFNSSAMSTPAYKDVKIAFKVVEENNSKKMIVNTAEISDEADTKGNSISKNTLEDIDSTPGNGNEDGKDENHNFKEDDIDKDYIILQKFDLALRKFITAVNGKEITTRIPEITINESGKITYIHPKEPILIANGNLVTYTIRVYNEGTVDGYAQEIVDNVPEGLEYLPDNDTNKYYDWKLDNGKIKTNYLSRQKAVGNLIKAFDRNTMKTPNYKDLKVVFKVTDQKLPDNKILINTAEIFDDADKDGNPVEDVDSTPGNNNDDGKDENHNFKEDDIDKEYVKVQYFDLALLKWVTKVITTVDGTTTERETGHQPVRGEEKVVKQEINRKKINETTVKFEYTIRVINEGQIAGYAKEISDYIPQGLKFVKDDNPAWTEKDGKVTTRILENILLQPGQSADIKIILTWINDSNNMGTKINTAEISEDKNDFDAPDIDSTPNNKVPKEDDIDDAPVALSTSTGEGKVVYFGVGSLVLVILIGGVFLIKKYVV